MTAKLMLVDIPTLYDLEQSLGDEMLRALREKQTVCDRRLSLPEAYARVLSMLFQYAQGAERPKVAMTVFSKARDIRDQSIADWAVYDLEKPFDPNRFNWHLQNVSQVVFNGAIVVSAGDLSIHT